jgi:hypothetical protein
MTKIFRMILVSAAALALAASAPQARPLLQDREAGAVPFVPERWDLSSAKVVEHLGRQALTGAAFLKDAEFEDGVIECDVAMKAGVRSYPGVLFRIGSAEEYERVYLRPHRSPLYDDAVQYVAAFHGLDSWQLYNGPGFSARAVIPTERWVRVKIEVLGTQARVYLDGAAQPALVVGGLARGKSRGGLGLMTVADGNSHFSNFSFRRDASLSFPPAPLPDRPPGCVLDWEVSAPFRRLLADFDRYPDAKALGLSGWTKAAARPDGVLDVSRTCGRQGNEPDAVLARSVIRAEKDGPRKFWLGYSDEIGLFLNGRPVFYGNSAYRSRDTSFLGILGPYDAVVLPLIKGDNELVVVLGEYSGGWGLILQDAEAVHRAPGVEESWITGREFLIPESAAYDPATDFYYVSNYDGYNPSRGAGRQFISKLTARGETAVLRWVGDLNNPTGLAVRDGRLYAVERGGLVEIDIASAKVVGRTALPGAVMPNDVAPAGAGDVYVSDSAGNCIYRVSGGTAEVWLSGPDVAAPNGIHVLGGKLIVGTNGDGCLKAADLATKEITTLANLGRGIIDGIQPDGRGGLLVSHNEGRLFRVSADGRAEKILDTTARRVSLADFAYDPGRNAVVVPTFTDGRVASFSLGRE